MHAWVLGRRVEFSPDSAIWYLTSCLLDFGASRWISAIVLPCKPKRWDWRRDPLCWRVFCLGNAGHAPALFSYAAIVDLMSPGCLICPSKTLFDRCVTLSFSMEDGQVMMSNICEFQNFCDVVDPTTPIVSTFKVSSTLAMALRIYRNRTLWTDRDGRNQKEVWTEGILEIFVHMTPPHCGVDRFDRPYSSSDLLSQFSCL